MTAESETFARFLDGTALFAEQAPRPDNPEDAEDILSALHPLMATTEGLHDEIVGCYGPIDETGRCADCGRLVALGMWRMHPEGPGCFYAIPIVSTIVWLVQHREAIPVVGNLLWRHRNRRSAAARHDPPSEPPPGGGS